MHIAFAPEKLKNKAISVFSITTEQFPQWLEKQDESLQLWVKNVQFSAESGAICLLPDSQHNVASVLLGLRDADDFWAFGALPAKLPEGIYRLENSLALKRTDQIERAFLAFGLGHYQFSKYKSEVKPYLAKLELHKAIDIKTVEHFLTAIESTRDLINTPAEDMGPEQIEFAAKNMAKAFDAKISVVRGDQLLAKNYPAIHAVGRASHREPRMIDLRWNSGKKYPKVTLVGKGVCFDTGGLDLKTASGMLLMKKDMAGSAMMLALAQLIMSHKLKVELRVLIGAVDNAVSGNSYRPGDVVPTRAGKTVEITNTDAEGRMVLCDLLYEACEEDPDLVIDFATLTGAARVALGEDLPALYAQPQSFANDLLKAAERVNDPIWQMPLAQQYRDKLKSNVADMINCAESPYGGSITAALFLQAFVKPEIKWAHVDVAAWHFKPKAGRPIGGDAFAVRAMFEYLQKHF